MANNYIQLDNVNLRYGGEADGTLALQDMNLRVDRGEFVAVVGPSGCGKSTLMKVVTGLWMPDSGVVIVGDKEVYKPLDFVGMAFQNPTLLPWRTTLNNILLPIEIKQGRIRRGDKEPLKKARNLLQLVGLTAFESKYPWHLAGGMQQRASLCRALIHEPSLLMLDEPFDALDMFTREELWAALQDVWLTRQPTVVLVTHDLREAVFLADRIVVMSARPGRVLASYDVNIPRPRTLGAIASKEATDLIQVLRDHISKTRQDAA